MVSVVRAVPAALVVLPVWRERVPRRAVLVLPVQAVPVEMAVPVEPVGSVRREWLAVPLPARVLPEVMAVPAVLAARAP